jgi:hypothetical protein
MMSCTLKNRKHMLCCHRGPFLSHVHPALDRCARVIAHAQYILCQMLTYFSRIMPNAVKLPILLKIMAAKFI